MTCNYSLPPRHFSPPQVSTMPSTRGYRTFALPSGILILALSLVVTGLAAYLTNRSIELRNIVNDYIKNQTYDPSNRFEYNSERVRSGQPCSMESQAC